MALQCVWRRYWGENKIALLTTCSSYCITILASGALYYVLWKENRNRGTLEGDDEQRDKLAFKDLTDKENPYFRYVL